MAWGIGVAVVTWLIGVAVLGQDWQGHQRTPGVWIDGVSPAQWGTCWAALALVAVSTAPHLRGWAVRLLSLVPLVGWIVWQLRAGALGPIPMLVYVLPTGLVWCGALVAGTWAHRWWARSADGQGTSTPS